MSIEFACPKCKKQYRVKDQLAGKSAKCSKCDHRFKVPEPIVVDDLANDDDLGSWFDDELSSEASSKKTAVVAALSQQAKKSCSACGSPLADGAVLCVACGFDSRSGKKHETRKVVEEKESSGKTAVSQSASLARGSLFSALGAALGAIVWVVVVLFTGYEIGWIAWGLGFASGAGMAIGHEDDDGTTAGIVAAGISTLGIVGAKFFIFEHMTSQMAEMGISLEALGTLVGEPITFGTLFGPIDGLFILLAVASAYKIGSGQVSD